MSAAEIKLATPGAGLPSIERIINGCALRIHSALSNSRKLRLKLINERNLILSLVKHIPPTDRSRQVLIPRVWGIEDSSRNWSIDMTLQHLVITTSGMTKIAELLCDGKVPGWEVRIENVKPPVEADSEIEQKFIAAIDALHHFLSTETEFRTSLQHVHPWFGSLNAFQWLNLAVLHCGIHRRQLASIKSFLPKV